MEEKQEGVEEAANVGESKLVVGTEVRHYRQIHIRGEGQQSVLLRGRSREGKHVERVSGGGER